MSKALDVGQYNFTRHDALMLDTNIWLFLYGPQRPRSKNVDIYSQVFKKILAAHCRICIDVLIVSEFINRYARLQWDILGNPQGNFKQFRRSQDFKPIAQEIAAGVRSVLKHCSRIDSGFETVDAMQLMAEYEAGDADFNDQVIADACRRKELKLITDDSDFMRYGITVISANKKLLN